jgi:hypothetical protein
MQQREESQINGEGRNTHHQEFNEIPISHKAEETANQTRGPTLHDSNYRL